MSWATDAINRLWLGETVKIRPTGSSMTGRIESGQLCTLETLRDHHELCVGDIVLVTVGKRDYLHLIKKIRGDQYLIGNNRGGENGWVTRAAIHGRCTRVTD